MCPATTLGKPFSSTGEVANFLDTSHRVVRYSIDTWKPEGIKGYYLFSQPLTEK